MENVDREERWLPVPGAKRYEVSDRGRLRSLVTLDAATGGPYVMAWCLSDGYACTRIGFDDGQRRTVFAHRLVAAAFLGPKPTPEHQALHRNDVRTDNTVENLRWGTRLDNAADAKRNGSHLPIDPEKCNPGKLGAATVRAIRNRVNDSESVSSIAKDLGLSYAIVYSVASGQSYRHIKQSSAETERARLEFRIKREQARAARDNQRALATVEALERVAQPEGQRRRQAPHSTASAPATRRAA